MIARRLASVLLMLLPFAALGDGPSVGASHVWIRQPPPGIGVVAGYLSVQNFTAKPLDLISISSPDFGSVEMHRSFIKDGQEQMESVPAVTIPAHGSMAFKPGSYHLMLMQPKKILFPGDIVTLDLSFSDGSELTIMAPVRHDPPAH
ncbi:MAG TPA: copper chaperone PCu(A)C [Gammaproteobacteria bacterium]|nr:copper chaperone PCu(A)C [Gammaproteobacteria bacterium]